MFALAAIAGNMIQHRLVWSAEQMKPKFSKVSPGAGFKRVFGKQAAANFLKGLVQGDRARRRDDGGAVAGALSARGDGAVRSVGDHGRHHQPDAETDGRRGGDAAPWSRSRTSSFSTGRGSSGRRCRCRRFKDEYKQSEGDPHIKGKLRQLRQQRMKKRMMAAVPKASVIITNPTHYAVALSYERGMAAPICVAKGVDNMALKIREIAGKHDIPIVENVALARALHATVEIDDEIPVEHYHAVAEIIGYVMGLKRGFSGRPA